VCRTESLVGMDGGTKTSRCAAMVVREHMQQYAQLVSALLQAFLPPGDGPDPPPSPSSSAVNASPEELMERLLQTDHALLRSVDQLREHQREQQRLARLREEVEKKDRMVDQLALQLQQVQATLQRVVDDTKGKLSRQAQGEEGGEAPLDVDDVVAYAHKVSCTTSAPPNWNPNMPLRVFLPPAPNEALFVQGNYFHNTTSAPIPDYSHLTDMEQVATKLVQPEQIAEATFTTQLPGIMGQEVQPAVQLPTTQAAAGLQSSEPVKQILLDLNPEDGEGSEEEDDDEWI